MTSPTSQRMSASAGIIIDRNCSQQPSDMSRHSATEAIGLLRAIDPVAGRRKVSSGGLHSSQSSEDTNSKKKKPHSKFNFGCKYQ